MAEPLPRRLLCLLLPFCLIGCDQTQAEREAIRNKLLDPESAQFTEVRVRGQYVCGYVRAKSPKGVYAAPSRFLVFRNGAGPWIEGEREDSSAQYDPPAWKAALARTRRQDWRWCEHLPP